MDTLKIDRVPLDSLHTDPANARSHSERNLDVIRGSLARFGQHKPIAVDRLEPKKGLLDGVLTMVSRLRCASAWQQIPAP